MPINNCFLIVIEGPDKVGKETQSKMLLEALPRRFQTDGRPLKVEMEEIPYDDKNIHQKIYDMLKSGEAVEHPEGFQTFQAANRMVWQHTIMPNLTRHHDVLILDRWNISAWVYGRASGLSDSTLGCLLRDIIEPDLVFVFYGDPFFTAHREDDSYEKNRDFMARVRTEYQRWADENAKIAIKIDANRSREAIHEELLQHCQERLPFSGT